MTFEYYVAEAESADDLGKILNDMLQNGWKLHGHLTIVPNGGLEGFHLYAQALVKEVEQRGPWS